MVTKMKQAADYYSNTLGYAIIPVGKDKKPLVGWKQYQEKFPTAEEVAGWWEKWPDANIGIITGKINGIFVIDIDDPEKGIKALRPYFRLEELEAPMCHTTKGLHIYFQYFDGANNFTRAFEGTDGRGEGGYVIAPPSRINGGPEYKWEPGRGLHQKSPSPLPEMLKGKLVSMVDRYVLPASQPASQLASQLANANKGIVALLDPKTDLTPENNAEIERNNDSENRNKPQQTQQSATERNKRNRAQQTQQIPDGTRDDYLFHVANQLAKAGTPPEEIRDVLIKLSAQCNPPFPLREIDVKIKSALDRSKRRNTGMTDLIKEWLEEGPGPFTMDQIARDTDMTTPEKRHALRTYLSRLVQEGRLERKGKGSYLIPDNTITEIDPFAADGGDVPIILPLGLDRYFRPIEKNIIIVAGSPDSGKTALLLNVARDNIGNMPIRYFTSEMGPAELKNRLQYFEDTSPAEWRAVKFYERTKDFPAVIDPDGLNIVDFLEVTEDFYLVGRFIRDIFDKMNKGIVIIALQKNRGRELGRGAELSLEKPRLYLSMDSGKIKIVKCKNWADSMTNPNGLELSFKLIKGCKFIVSGLWRRPAAEGETNEQRSYTV